MEYLPNETLIHIFSFITRRRDLALVSLVCRHWNTLAFADLYCTLYLERQADVDLISKRILAKPKDKTLNSHCISSALRHLTIDPLRYTGGEPAKSFPKKAVFKLANLEHLAWTFVQSPKSHITPVFRDHCPNLRSVELKILYGDYRAHGEF